MSLSKHTIVNLMGNVLPMVLALVTVPLYLNYIGGERYGVLAIIWALFGYFGFFDFGFGRAVSQRMSRLSSADASECSNLLWTAIVSTFLLGLVGSFLLWMSADYILSHLIKMSESSREEVANALVWLLISLPLLLPTTVLNGALQARLRFVELNIIYVFGNILGQLLPLAFAASGYVQLQILVPAVVATRLITICLSFSQCRHHVPLIGSPHFELKHLKPLIGYGGWVSVMTMLSPLLMTVDRFVIAALSGASAVAHYTVPYDLVSRSMVISSSLSSAIFPRLAAANVEQAGDIAIRATRVLVAVMTPVVIFALFTVHPFLNIWVGEAFSNSSAKVAEVILLGVWINSLVIPHHARLLAADNPKIVVIIYLIQIPVYFLVLWIGITKFGIIGAAVAWSLRVLLDTLMLLRAAGVLGSTFRTMFFPFTLVGLAGLVTLSMKFSSSLHWTIGLILLLISLLRDRHLLIEMFSGLKFR